MSNSAGTWLPFDSPTSSPFTQTVNIEQTPSNVSRIRRPSHASGTVNSVR